jgi:hypothetical protein
MSLLSSGSYAVAVLLGLAGAAKLASPVAVTRALRAAKLPGWRVLRRLPVARTLGVVEVAVALAMLVVGGRIAAALLTASYAAITLVAWRLARTADGTDCGCFGGASDAPVGWGHVAITAIATGVAALATVSNAPSLWRFMGDQPGWGLPFLLGTVLVTYLVFLLLTALPALIAARRLLEVTR